MGILWDKDGLSLIAIPKANKVDLAIWAHTVPNNATMNLYNIDPRYLKTG